MSVAIVAEAIDFSVDAVHIWKFHWETLPCVIANLRGLKVC